jgi:hypothetical protein
MFLLRGYITWTKQFDPGKAAVKTDGSPSGLDKKISNSGGLFALCKS